ncbi:HNH endonuclease [Synechococcus phage MA10]
MKHCLNCGEEHNKPKFCSRSCAATYNNKKFPKRSRTAWETSFCAFCSIEFEYQTHKSTGKYCSNECSAKGRKQETIDKWKEGELSHTGHGYVPGAVRNYLIEQSSGCSQCGWNGLNHHTGRPCLEIDHIDDDPFNHSPENLQVLCPNCHAQKTLPPTRSKGGRYSRGTKHPKHQEL